MGSIRGEGGAGGGGGGGLADLVDDTTPQLGGNLDVNGFNVGGATPTQLGYLAATTAAGAALLDDANAAAQRTTLGLGTAAVAASGDFQAANANLTALAGQTGEADKVSYWTAAATLALATLTAFGRSLCAAADAAGVRTLLGLGTAATTDASAYQATDAELTALAGLTSAADKGIQFTGIGTAATYDLTAAGKALLDDADAAAQRTTLGLGTAAEAAATAFASLAPATTSRNVIQPTATGAINLVLKKIASQTGRLLDIQKDDGTSYLYVSPTGAIFGSAIVPAANYGTLFEIVANGSQAGYFRITAGDVGVDISAHGRFYVRDSFSANNRIVLQAGASGLIGMESTQQIKFGDTYVPTYTAGIGYESAGVVKATNGSTSYGAFKGTKYESTITTGTAPLTVASTTVVTNLNSDKLDGKDATDFAPCTQATLTAAASVALDFAAAGLATLTTDQNTTFTTSNRAAGRQPYNLRIIGGGAHTLTFPAGWKWLNSTMPAAIASGKTGRLCLECYGSADTDVVASFAVEA